MSCRSSDYGSVIYQCEDCSEIHIAPRRGGNRHCPGCQHHKTQQWLQRQMDRQLPGHHFRLTFTVPEPLRAFIYHHQQVAYNALFSASAEAFKTLALDPKQLSADLPGFFGVLPTWGRQLQYHPHVHYGVPGGAFSSEDHQWHPTSAGFFLPVKALSTRYWAKFRDLMAKAGLLQKIPAEVWETEWNVNCQAVGAGEGAVKYLAPSVFKVAIADSRIVKVDNDQVTFRYRQPHSHRERTMTLDALEFIRRFLQHVLPSGLMKVRYDGFLPPSCSIPWEEVKARIEMTYGFALVSPEAEPLVTPRPSPADAVVGHGAISAPCCHSGDVPPPSSGNLPWLHQDSPQPRRDSPAPLPGLGYSPRRFALRLPGGAAPLCLPPAIAAFNPPSKVKPDLPNSKSPLFFQTLKG